MRKTISIDETIQTAYLKLSKPFKTAFVSACFWGIAAHLYMFMNKLPNYDDMGLNGFGATFRLGRWFLWVLGASAYHLDFVYSLPWVNGMVTILFIALSAGLVAEYLGANPQVFGYSMRLGANIKPMPQNVSKNENVYEWRWDCDKQHYNYPWELDCTLYRKEDVLRLLAEEKPADSGGDYAVL